MHLYNFSNATYAYASALASSMEAGATFSSGISKSPYPLAGTAIQFWGYYISEFYAIVQGMDLAAIPNNDHVGFGGSWNAVPTISLILYSLEQLGRVAVLAIPVVARLSKDEVRSRFHRCRCRLHSRTANPNALQLISVFRCRCCSLRIH